MILDLLFKKMGYIKKSHLNKQLNFACNVSKRLDEHRETVEAIQSKTTLFNDYWHINHMATQDDYLMRLYFMVNGYWPENRCEVRERPEILGCCKLPEYPDDLP